MSFEVTTLPGATFGGLVTAPSDADIVSAAEASPATLPGPWINSTAYPTKG